MNNILLISIIVLIIISLEYFVEKKVLGIIILHNNDHTLNKVLQNIMAFMNNHLIHYQILVIKEKYPSKKRSTGYLFNIGMRQLPGFNHYLFIDTLDCNLKNFLTIHKSNKITTKDLFINDSINYFDKICSIVLSKNTFKKIDGFSNKSNKSFIDFIKEINKNKDKYGGYFSMNLDLKYDIVDRTMINSLTSRITIKYLNL